MQLLGCKWYYVLQVICAALGTAAAQAQRENGTKQEYVSAWQHLPGFVPGFGMNEKTWKERSYIIQLQHRGYIRC